MPTQEVIWKGRRLTIEFEVMPAEPDIGLPSPYPEMLSIKDEKGNEFPTMTVLQENEILDLIVMPEED